MKVVAIIPARYASSRFPGKPLASQTGKPLIQHVVERVLRARRIDDCLVATDDQRIADAVESFGGCAVLTRDDHQSGTDRIAEAVEALGGEPDDIVLNVQGDEPEIEPDHLDRLVECLSQSSACAMATLACPFPADVDPADPNCVKVVIDDAGRALYFSRAPLPYVRASGTQADARRLLHLGVYAYRRDFLLQFARWESGALERVEQLEQLRALERGCAIAVRIVERACVGIDTPREYKQFVARQLAADAGIGE